MRKRISMLLTALMLALTMAMGAAGRRSLTPTAMTLNMPITLTV